jgi:L-fuculose-phosphate aldolase
MTTESQLRADIVEIGRRMYARGYTASNDGNISVRLGSERLLMTPKSVCKGFMTPDMMCITDLSGQKLQGDRDPSSEMLMHLEVYRQRPDVQGRRSRTPADRHRICSGRHSARSRRAGRSADDAG